MHSKLECSLCISSPLCQERDSSNRKKCLASVSKIFQSSCSVDLLCSHSFSYYYLNKLFLINNTNLDLHYCILLSHFFKHSSGDIIKGSSSKSGARYDACSLT